MDNLINRNKVLEAVKRGTTHDDIMARIEIIESVPTIPIPENATKEDMLKALFPTEYGTLNFNIHRGSWLNSPYRRGETDES